MRGIDDRDVAAVEFARVAARAAERPVEVAAAGSDANVEFKLPKPILRRFNDSGSGNVRIRTVEIKDAPDEVQVGRLGGSPHFEAARFELPALTIKDATPPLTITFTNDRGKLFTIHADGRIERGAAFTTDDAASLEFWRCVERAFPEFLPREKLRTQSLILGDLSDDEERKVLLTPGDPWVAPGDDAA